MSYPRPAIVFEDLEPSDSESENDLEDHVDEFESESDVTGGLSDILEDDRMLPFLPESYFEEDSEEEFDGVGDDFILYGLPENRPVPLVPAGRHSWRPLRDDRGGPIQVLWGVASLSDRSDEENDISDNLSEWSDARSELSNDSDW